MGYKRSKNKEGFADRCPTTVRTTTRLSKFNQYSDGEISCGKVPKHFISLRLTDSPAVEWCLGPNDLDFTFQVFNFSSWKLKSAFEIFKFFFQTKYLLLSVFQTKYILFFPFIFISGRLITLQYCSGFCHTLTWISHGFTCIPHPDPPSHLSLYPIPLGLPSVPAPSTCLMHPT